MVQRRDGYKLEVLDQLKLIGIEVIVLCKQHLKQQKMEIAIMIY